MNSLVLCEKRKAILEQTGHILVTGGPGCGKTTIALLKARERCRSLKPGQAVLFLSFSRAAVQQILTKGATLLTRKERVLIHVQTYHSFCIELLQAHGHLLLARLCKFVFPGEERLRKSSFGEGWDAERTRLATEENLFCFDLVARGASNLLRRCAAVRTLYAEKFPLIIVDEFQDTDNAQWAVVKALAAQANVMCLADAEQRIFDYRPEVDPKRIAQAVEVLKPSIFDFGSENHRSPAAGILSFADAVLHNRGPAPTTADVRVMTYYGKDFEQWIHFSVISSFHELKKRNVVRPTVAVLCRANTLVARASAALGQSHLFNGRTLPAIDHSVLWDAELSAAAAVVVGSLMDTSGKTTERLATCLRLLARYHHIKNAEAPSATALKAATSFGEAAGRATRGLPPRTDAEKQLAQAIQKGPAMMGDPMPDWLTAREILKTAKALQPLFIDASLVRLFGARDALATGLGQRWLANGYYSGAAELVRQVLDRERLISTERAPTGCVVMNIHKAKGKEFDGVVIIEGAYSGAFCGTKEDHQSGSPNRRLLRVALTRARALVTLLRPNKAAALVD